MLGSGGVIVIDDAQNIVKQIARARALLRARELRAVHAVPRRHRVDDQDPRAHRRRRRHARRTSTRCWSIAEQHDRQDDLRAERLVRGAGRVGIQKFRGEFEALITKQDRAHRSRAWSPDG